MVFEAVSPGEVGDTFRSQEKRKQQRRQERNKLWGKRQVGGVLGQGRQKGRRLEDDEGTTISSL